MNRFLTSVPWLILTDLIHSVSTVRMRAMSSHESIEWIHHFTRTNVEACHSVAHSHCWYTMYQIFGNTVMGTRLGIHVWVMTHSYVCDMTRHSYERFEWDVRVISRGLIGYLIFIGHFPQKWPVLSGSFVDDSTFIWEIPHLSMWRCRVAKTHRIPSVADYFPRKSH